MITLAKTHVAIIVFFSRFGARRARRATQTKGEGISRQPKATSLRFRCATRARAANKNGGGISRQPQATSRSGVRKAGAAHAPGKSNWPKVIWFDDKPKIGFKGFYLCRISEGGRKIEVGPLQGGLMPEKMPLRKAPLMSAFAHCTDL